MSIRHCLSSEVLTEFKILTEMRHRTLGTVTRVDETIHDTVDGCKEISGRTGRGSTTQSVVTERRRDWGKGPTEGILQ